MFKCGLKCKGLRVWYAVGFRIGRCSREVRSAGLDVELQVGGTTLAAKSLRLSRWLQGCLYTLPVQFPLNPKPLNPEPFRIINGVPKPKS